MVIVVGRNGNAIQVTNVLVETLACADHAGQIDGQQVDVGIVNVVGDKDAVQQGRQFVQDGIADKLGQFGGRDVARDDFEGCRRSAVAEFVLGEKVGLRDALEIDESALFHLMVVHLQEIQRTGRVVLAQKQVLRGARASHVQGVGTDLFFFVSGKREIRRVESDDKDVFALAAFGRVKRGKDDFAVDDTVVHFVRFKRGDVDRNVFFDKAVGQTHNIVVARLDAVGQNEEIRRQIALVQKVLDVVQNNVFNVVARVAEVGDGGTVAIRQHHHHVVVVVFAQEHLVDKGGHGLRQTVRCAQGASLKRGGS